MFPEARLSFFTRRYSQICEYHLTKRKIALWLAYLGSNYRGSQYNLPGPTIETVLEEALHTGGFISESNYRQISKIGLSRSSRTDKGVHSLKTIVSLKLLWNWLRFPTTENSWRYNINDQCKDLPKCINQYLPPDIRVIAACPVSRGWNVREEVIQRKYEYLIPESALKGTLYEVDLESAK